MKKSHIVALALSLALNVVLLIKVLPLWLDGIGLFPCVNTDKSVMASPEDDQLLAVVYVRNCGVAAGGRTAVALRYGDNNEVFSDLYVLGRERDIEVSWIDQYQLKIKTEAADEVMLQVIKQAVYSVEYEISENIKSP